MNINILIVDDIQANLFSLESLINELGIEEKHKINVMKSLSGEEALKIAMNNPLDLIILDVLMPIINGFEVAKFLKSNTKTKDIPIIFLTAAFISEEFVKNGFEVGAIDYFIKPVDKHIFLNKIKLYIAIALKSKLLEESEKQLKLLNTSLEQRVQAAHKKIEQYVDIMDKNVISSLTDLDGIITEVSEAFCNTIGYSKDELIGKSHKILRHLDMKDDIYIKMWDTLVNNEIWNGEIKNIKKGGSLYWVNETILPIFNDENIKTGYMTIREDITDKKIIEELSITDELTKIYNRRYFNEVLTQELNRANRKDRSISFLMLDVDYFKLYNDTYGHQEGDNVLLKIGKVLKDFSKRAGDFAFRLGGEEFGLLFHEESSEEALNFANNLLKSIELLKIPHSKNSASEFITVSVGLIHKNVDKTTSAEEMYKEVDNRLYKAKELGRNNVVNT